MGTQKNRKKYTFKGVRDKKGITLIACVLLLTPVFEKY